ncbi:MAG: HNH endonuclease [Firmicutes bacterium]|nr:HNH endonuclease [Bacillota bacterium]
MDAPAAERSRVKVSLRKDTAVREGVRPAEEAGSHPEKPKPAGAAPAAPAGSPRRSSPLQEPVLVLNATFEPINVTAVRRALVLLLKGVAQAEEHNHAEIRSANTSMRVPSVIRLLTYRRIPQQTRALSRKNILLRDRNTCQFCGRTLPSSELTLDHVIPRSRGGLSTWENLVTCCYRCNNQKGNRTPEEVGLRLVRRPRPFTLHTSRQLMRLMGHQDEKWRKYLFY